MPYICKTLIRMFLVHSLLDQAALELCLVQLIAIILTVMSFLDLILYYLLDEIEQIDMFCDSPYIFMYITIIC